MNHASEVSELNKLAAAERFRHCQEKDSMLAANQAAKIMWEKMAAEAERRHMQRRAEDEATLAAREREHAAFVAELRSSHAEEKSQL